MPSESRSPRSADATSVIGVIRPVLDGLAAVMLIIASAVVIWVMLSRPRAVRPDAASDPPIPQQLVPLEGAALKGDLSAPVVMIEYSDFQCPACRNFANTTLPSVVATYVVPGKVLLAFRHMPLKSVHPNAVQAAKAAECARREGKFWDMHDRLFDVSAGPITIQAVNDRALAVGLSKSLFSACMSQAETDSVVRLDANSATALQLRGTPSFLLGVADGKGRVRVKRVLSGAPPYPRLAAVLDELLKIGGVTVSNR